MRIDVEVIASRQAPMVKLVISDNEGTTTVVPLVRDEISIGRKDGNTIRLTERNVSRRHCTLRRHNGSYLVCDHGSYNGVIVNGARIEGEAPVRPGDQIRIGDYTMLLESEAQAQAQAQAVATKSKPPPDDLPNEGQTEEAEPTIVKALPTAKAKPARLVVLTAPVAGAEFVLPEKGEARIGRASDMEISIDHRSVSREHVAIAGDGGRYRITDRSSANGVLINGQQVAQGELSPGDVLELGEVLVRFVGPEESYVFDPSDARLYGRARARSSRGAVMMAAGIMSVALVGALYIALDQPAEVEVAADPAAQGPARESIVAAEVDQARFDKLIKACRDAMSGGRYAEAMAHAQAALNVRSAANEAAQCHSAARVEHEQEQAFVRGKAAFEAGDLDTAEKELRALSPQSAVAARPEVASVVSSFGEARAAEAELLLARDGDRARSLARGLLSLPLASDELKQRAAALLERPVVAAAAPQAPQPARARPRAEAPERAGETDRRSPMEIASACLARGDNGCVIRALSGKAQSAQELGLLIETYRATGNVVQAQRHMAIYVQRFPTARRADAYRQMLERR